MNTLPPTQLAMLGWSEIILIMIVLGFLAVVGIAIVFIALAVNRKQTGSKKVPRINPQEALAKCPRCGSVLAAGVAQGLCPQCVMAAGFETDVPDKSSSVRNVPSPAELAGHFPQFEIVKLLGRGGMGWVYQARQKQLDRLVALKILPPEAGRDPTFAERFQREARALARLNHPNIVAIYEFGQAGPYWFFVLEYVDGQNLRQCERANRLTEKDAVATVLEICDGLQFAHDQGIVHRDIKPENILIDPKGRVKIADFGVARILESGPRQITLTAGQNVLGTPYYMAPEQLDKSDQTDHRVDIFALGVVLYEMLTGSLPLGRFEAPSESAGSQKGLDPIIDTALQQRPQRRYQTVAALKADLECLA
ncbi:protein kinase [bacterium]|nr:protein kinase [bacterium]